MRTILAASGVVKDSEGRFLLVLRTKAPEAGTWTVPGGSAEPGETLEEAAAREVLEETGIIVEVKHEVWSLTLPAGPDSVYEIHDFPRRTRRRVAACRRRCRRHTLVHRR